MFMQDLFDSTRFISLDSLPTSQTGKTRVKVFFKNGKDFIPSGTVEMANSLILNTELGFKIKE